MSQTFQIDEIDVGPRDGQSELFLIAGPCVIESEAHALKIANAVQRLTSDLAVPYIFKASYDKANRTSLSSYRGPGVEEGCRILRKVADETGLPVLTDVHTAADCDRVAQAVDVLQIPAFLCRQTDMIVAGAEAALKHKRRLNVKKGQFLAPWDAKNIVEKFRAVEEKIGIRGGPDALWLTERGSSFGYNTLVVDMGSFQVMKGFGVPTIHDATHSVQQPGGGAGGKSTGGKRELIESLTRAAFAAGADGLFMECHPRPEVAKSDGPNAFYLEHVGAFVKQILQFRALAQSLPKLLPTSR